MEYYKTEYTEKVYHFAFSPIESIVTVIRIMRTDQFYMILNVPVSQIGLIFPQWGFRKKTSEQEFRKVFADVTNTFYLKSLPKIDKNGVLNVKSFTEFVVDAIWFYMANGRDKDMKALAKAMQKTIHDGLFNSNVPATNDASAP